MSDTFSIRGTQSRPAWLPLFVISRNNLNPRVVAEPDALVVKVVTTNRLPWSAITEARNTITLVGYAMSVTSGGWSYVLHFRTAAERDRLRERLRAEGVPVV